MDYSKKFIRISSVLVLNLYQKSTYSQSNRLYICQNLDYFPIIFTLDYKDLANQHLFDIY